MTNDVYQLLETWGRWSRDRCLPQGVKCGIAIIMAQNVGSVLGVAPVCDEDAQLIERVMRVMKQRKPDHYDVLYMYYVDGLPSRKIAKSLGRSNGWASDMLHAGQAWVDGAMASSVFIA